MAYVTKTINGTTSSSSLWTFKVVVTETAIDTANKTSTVRLEAFLGRKEDVGDSYFAGTYKLTLSINGSTYRYSESLYKNATVKDNDYVSLGSATFVVTQTTTPLTVKINGSMSTSSFNPKSASISETNVTLTKLHEAPVLSSMAFEETNSILTATGIGGDYFVPHLSVKKITATPILYDNATLTNTRIINESNSYSNASGTPNVVTMDLRTKTLYTTYDKGLGRTVPKLSVEFTDSTGATAEWAYPYTYLIPYTKPNLIATSSSVKRNGQISGKVNLNLTGTFYNAAIGNKSNTISLSFKYWKQGTSEPTTYYTIPASAYTISGNNITISNWNMAKNTVVITDVLKDSAYRFKIKAVDAFGMSQEIELTCPKGEWLMARFKDRIDFKKITQGGVQVATVNDTQKHIVSAYLQDDQAFNNLPAWNSAEVAFSVADVVGNKLTLQSNRVTIGAGVKYVTVSASAYFSGNTPEGQLRAWIQVLNASGTERLGIESYMYKSGDNINAMLIVPTRTVAVTEGEQVRLAIQIGNTATFNLVQRGTTLHVEVVE